MTKIFLFHNSDVIHHTFSPRDDTRPMFYWYSDRFASHDGTTNYLHLFVIDPDKDNVELRSRTDTQDFDALHRQFLHFKDYKQGKYPELFYDEPGIVMSFSTMTPTIILKTHSRDDDTPSFLQQTYEIVYPSHLATTDAYIKLFHKPYDELYSDNPIPFNEIPALVNAIPDINSVLPLQHVDAEKDGKYYYGHWKPMSSHPPRTWL